MSTLIERDYAYQAAGRIWRVPELHLQQKADGTVAVQKSEIDRINRAIANQICGSLDPLTVDELTFLCDVTAHTFADAASRLGVHKSTLSKWRQHGAVPRLALGTLLKRWFWFELFGEQANRWSTTLGHFRDDADFLVYVRDRAIHQHLADPIEWMRAS